MADPPLGLTYVAPALALPAWLSYLSAPTATVLAPYTVATLGSGGVPTLITGAVEITQYETALLQLPITVDSAADVRGQNLGGLYTTAGGQATETVVNEVGGTRRFTLGASATRALAGATDGASAATAAPVRGSTSAYGGATSRLSQGPPSAAPAVSPPTRTSITGGLASVAASSATSQTDSALAALSSASRVQQSLVTALDSAASASTLDSQVVSSISNALVAASLAHASASAAAASRASSPSRSSSSVRATSALPSVTSTSQPSSASSSVLSSSSPLGVAGNKGSGSHSLTPSQLAAAIAAPLAFFFLTFALLLLCCCCVRRRRRRRAERRVSEEEGLLGGGGTAGAPQEHARGAAWEWVVPRHASDEGGGRVSRASGRSALSRLTGGLFGAGAARSTRSGRSAAASTPWSSPRDVPEKGFVPEGEKGRSGEGGAARQYGPAREADVGEQVGPTTPLLGAEPATPTSLGALPLTTSDGWDAPRVHYAPPPAAAFEDIDLTSPRPAATEEGFDRIPQDMQETRVRPIPLPVLPPLQPTDGSLRLSTLYDPTIITSLPPSPSAYEPPSARLDAPAATSFGSRPDPLSHAEAATTSLGELWHGYETSSPFTDGDTSPRDDKRGTRLGYLSWSGGAGDADSAAAPRYGPECTPPQTPEEEGRGMRVIAEDDDSIMDGSRGSNPYHAGLGVSTGEWMSGMGMWAGRRVSPDDRSLEGSDEVERMRSEEEDEAASQRRGSGTTSLDSELGGTSLPESSLFLNDARWTGSRRPLSPPPFSSFQPISTPSVSYDPLVFVNRPPASASLDALPVHARRSTSYTADSLSRYDSSPSHSALPLDSPLVYTPPRFSVVYPARGRAARQRSHESGLSVLDRIAASFGSVKEGLSVGLGVDFGDGVTRTRSAARQREISTESMTDPFHQSLGLNRPRLPALPSPANTPPRQRSLLSLNRRSSQSLRHAHSQPALLFGGTAVPPIPETSPTQAGSSSEGGGPKRWVDPFDEDEAPEHAAYERGPGWDMPRGA